MTHLACGDEPVRSVSMEQLNLFEAVAAHFPAVPRSIANSSGAFLPRAFHCDVVCTGVALFGVSPLPEALTLQPAVRLDRKRVVSGTRVYVRVVLGGRRILTTNHTYTCITTHTRIHT